jgi:hypothetical protein
MKNILVVLLLLLGNQAWVSAQELSVVALTETKSNAEWLSGGNLSDTTKYPLSNYEKEEISKILDHLETGVVISKLGLFTTLIPLVNIPLNSTVGLFGRIPASYRLNRFIKLKYTKEVLDSKQYSLKNLKHLLEAKRNLDKARINSNVGLVFQVAGAILISQLNSKNSGFLTPSSQEVGIILIPPLIFAVTTAVNLPRLNKAKRALSQIQ